MKQFWQAGFTIWFLTSLWECGSAMTPIKEELTDGFYCLASY
jgi:hypothetical protein